MVCKNFTSSKIIDLCSSLSLNQLVEELARITPTSSFPLDLILANRDNVSQSNVFHSSSTDYNFFMWSENLKGLSIKLNS